MNPKQLAAGLILVSFLCQGMASLIYQVSWEQAMEKIVGSAMPTMTMMVAIFLLGMGLGAYLFSKIRLNYHSAAKFYCLNQFFLFALGLIFAGSNGLDFLACLSVNNIDWVPFAYVIRLSLLCLYLLPTAILVGAGFPILLSLCGFCQLNISARIIYLFNLLGSAAGALLTGFVLLPHLGIGKTTVVAAAVHLIAGLLIAVVSRVFELSLPVENEDKATPAQKTFSLPVGELHPPVRDAGSASLAPTQDSPLQLQRSGIDSKGQKTTLQFPQAFWLLMVVAVAGFFNMFLELVFIRYYSLVMGSSLWAYSIVLVVMLLALGCGTFLTGKAVRSRLTISLLFMLGSASLLFTSFFLSQLPFIFVGLKFLIGFSLSSILVLICTIFPVCLCLGAVLPCCFNVAEIKGKLSPVKPGQIYAVSLFAAVTGCLAGGIIAIPFFNLFSNHAIYLAFVLSALTLLLTGLIICSPVILSDKKISLTAAALSLLLCLALWPLLTAKLSWNEAALTAGLNYLSPGDLKAIKHLPTAVNLSLWFYKEGLSSTVSVTANPKLNVVCLKTDGQMEAALPLNPNLPAPSSDEKTQIMLGLLPSLFCRARSENVFLLGYGTGVTAHSILLNPLVEKLTVAELEPAVIEASHFITPPLASSLAGSTIYPCSVQPNDQNAKVRMNVNIMDGRCLLSLLDKRYDIIVSQPGEPSRSSSAHLYTLEFWQLAKSRLQAGGVFCQWLPLYAMDRSSLTSLCRTFTCVFPNTYIAKLDGSAELILLGFADYNSVLTTICLTPKSLPGWLVEYDQDQQPNQINKDDFPFVQYRLQSLLAKQGNSISSEMENMISSCFSPAQSQTFSK